MSPPILTPTLHVHTRNEWRAWLEKNHEAEKEIWLVFYKKHTGRPRISYDDAVEEALCFGWIDSIVRKIDDERYAQKFTPRRDTAKWSDVNIARIRKLIREGWMTPDGLAKIGDGVLGRPDSSRTRQEAKEPAIPPCLTEALETNSAARDHFNSLAPSYRRQYIGWVAAAKREETRNKRAKELVEILARGQKLGMK